MPVRTSVVVACGLGLLTLVGVGAVFGESLVALVAPPRTETAATVESQVLDRDASPTYRLPEVP